MDKYYGEFTGIPILNGDIFESDANAILHQVNCQGKMGSGVAKQVRERYPYVYELYKKACDEDKRQREHLGMGKSMLLGYAQVCPLESSLVGEEKCKQRIVNLFAQDKYGYDGKCYTDYDALQRCLKQVNARFRGEKVAVPYMMSCYRGGGNWDIVSTMIIDTLKDCDVTFYRYSE
jgi:O-acetyl-ADP-ribose deacetylase (regulator of RNase III)